MDLLDFLDVNLEQGGVLRREGEVLRFLPGDWDWPPHELEDLLEILPDWYGTGEPAAPGGLEMLRSLELRADPGMENYSSNPRRPCYRLRGRPVTPERAREIIRRTDSRLGELQWNNVENGKWKRLFPDFVGSCHFDQDWFPRRGDGPRGWSHPDGTIGCNGVTLKYPDFRELLLEMLSWKLAFPWLELCVAVSGWDERPRAWWDEELIPERLSDRDFAHDLEIGLCTHGRVIEVLDPEHAAERYLDYARRYAPGDGEVFEPDYYLRKNPGVCDEAYLLGCLRENGLEEEEARELARQIFHKE